MAYQMGVNGVMGFRKMLGAIVNGNYRLAAQEGMDSRWANQTPNRAKRLMDRLANIKA